MAKLYDVPFLAGDGSGPVMLRVRYIAGGFPRDEHTVCAYCHGDPCADRSDETTLIGAYMKRNKRAEACPCCDGKPS